jgi:hypothetical protein
MSRLALVTLLFVFPLAVFTQTRPQTPKAKTPPPPAVAADSASTSRLPVKRVVLYKNGIGYFEHTARVHGNQDLSIDFTTGQLNDVLKSLTVVDLGQGRIGSVRYNSIAPLDERLRSLRLPFGETISSAEYLTALRGARVEVRSSTSTATGRLLTVEKERRQKGKDEYEDVTTFAMVTDGGEMRNFELGPATSIRIADRELNDEVGRYLNLVGSSRARDLRRMTISALGSGDRDVFVSYISEVPVWKSTYRILIPAKSDEKPLLQGWAIVDNTVGEDWKDVELSLIAGAPQSFIQNISQPFYTRRPEVALPESYMLTPQTHEETMEAPAPPPPPGGVTEAVEVQASSGPVGAGVPGGVGGGAFTSNGGLPTNGRNFTQLSQLNAGIIAQAGKNAAAVGAKEAGDYFEYQLKEKITIGKNQSALVPILAARVEAEKVSLWNENDRVTLRALWLKNTSGLTVDAGTFNVLDADTFAGEGLLDTLHPDERRLLSYAADSALHVKMESLGARRPVNRVWISKGIMMLGHEQRDTSIYTAHNADKSARSLVIEHPAREGWKLSEKSPKPAETSTSFLRFQLHVAPGATEKFEIEESHVDYVQYQLTNIDDQQVALLVQDGSLTPAAQDALHRVLDQKNQVEALQSQINSRQHEIDAITKDQARVRENMKALKGTAEEKALVQRYTKQLDQQEDRLNTLQKEISDLQARHAQAQESLDQLIQSIALDEAR